MSTNARTVRSLSIPLIDIRQIRLEHAYLVLMGVVILAGLWLRSAPVVRNGFHEDEALYGYWGMEIASGSDPLLDRFPVDKPPLFLYELALFFMAFGHTESVARLPSLFASATLLVLVARLSHRIYGQRVALLATIALALNPFDISFATTAFTDPTLVLFVFLALSFSLARRPFWAGLSLGLALACKQQGLFFLPLVTTLGLVAGWRRTPVSESVLVNGTAVQRVLIQGRERITKLWRVPWTRAACGMSLPLGTVFWWDGSRAQRPGFLEQSLISYGGIGLALPATWGERASEWLEVIGTLCISPLLGIGFLAGIIALTIINLRAIRIGDVSERVCRAAWCDLVFIGYSAGFLVFHWLLTFNAWDRYLLGLLPLWAMLAARILDLPVRIGAAKGGRMHLLPIPIGLVVMVLVMMLAPPAQQAAQGRYPAGGDRGVYQGINQLVYYIKHEVPENAVIYHRWLGHHYRFYLYDEPHALRWYSTSAELAQSAWEWSDVPRWVAFPEWKEREDVEMALAGRGMRLVERHFSYRLDGSVAFRLFEIVSTDP